MGQIAPNVPGELRGLQLLWVYTDSQSDIYYFDIFSVLKDLGILRMLLHNVKQHNVNAT
jgi:hypothetical protein